ncbi:MAG TPA: ethanolamine ammonia-lyase subunit EutB [Pyrinomonadaceae bacterium]|jgi:ethanolamine ammonia-lyase large subunit
MNRQQELLQIFALANEFKEGDLPVGGTADDDVRREARAQLGALSLGEIARATLVEDEVSEMLAASLNSNLAAEISDRTVNELKSALLGPGANALTSRYSTPPSFFQHGNLMYVVKIPVPTLDNNLCRRV